MKTAQTTIPWTGLPQPLLSNGKSTLYSVVFSDNRFARLYSLFEVVVRSRKEEQIKSSYFLRNHAAKVHIIFWIPNIFGKISLIKGIKDNRIDRKSWNNGEKDLGEWEKNVTFAGRKLYPKVWDVHSKVRNVRSKVWDICSKLWNIKFYGEK